MTKNEIRTRLVVVLATVIAAVMLVAPTIIYFDLNDEQMAKVRKRAEAFNEFVPSYLPSKHVNLGLDLAGGIHLVLSVDLDKAMDNKVDRLRQRITDRLGRDEIKGSAKVRDDLRTIEVSFEDAENQAKYLKTLQTFEFEVLEKGSKLIALGLKEDFVERLKKDAISQAMRSIRNRVDSLGVAEPQISARGIDQVVVQLPGYDNPEEARRLLGRTAQLEFRMSLDEDTTVSSLNTTELPGGIIRCISTYTKPGGGSGNDNFIVGIDRDQVLAALSDKVGADKMVAIKEMDASRRPGLTRICEGELPGTPQEKLYRTYILTASVPLSGDHVVDAFVGTDPRTGRPDVQLIFNEVGKSIFGKLTSKNVGNRFAIVLEGMVDSAPVINEPIMGGSCQITLGSMGERQQQFKDAEGLAIVLKSGALPAPVTIAQDRTVGASLGEDSISAGRAAITIGGIAVIIFMMIYYSFAGFVANIALVLNLVFIMAVLSMFGATLTLPGIAGMVLTVGMAVDANVIIFERIREELLMGKTARSALSVGYQNAMSAIVDANITTGIAGMVLWQYGSGPIKGFAVTLVVGIIASLFTAIYVTRTVFELYLRSSDRELPIGITLNRGGA
ncbi:MAG: protein translocase subunit SecD [Myxococcota bacterium]|nr:protein translocase subunit SecD [Myxococcota bacterium]